MGESEEQRNAQDSPIFLTADVAKAVKVYTIHNNCRNMSEGLMKLFEEAGYSYKDFITPPEKRKEEEEKEE